MKKYNLDVVLKATNGEFECNGVLLNWIEINYFRLLQHLQSLDDFSRKRELDSKVCCKVIVRASDKNEQENNIKKLPVNHIDTVESCTYEYAKGTSIVNNITFANGSYKYVSLGFLLSHVFNSEVYELNLKQAHREDSNSKKTSEGMVNSTNNLIRPHIHKLDLFCKRNFYLFPLKNNKISWYKEFYGFENQLNKQLRDELRDEVEKLYDSHSSIGNIDFNSLNEFYFETVKDDDEINRLLNQYEKKNEKKNEKKKPSKPKIDISKLRKAELLEMVKKLQNGD